MRAASQMRWASDPKFSRFEVGRRELVLHREIAAYAPAIIKEIDALRTMESGAGNRHSAFRLKVGDAIELFARRARRGGMIASIVDDVYFGTNPRPMQELAIAVAASKRGIPLAEPMGAMVEWIGPA